MVLATWQLLTVQLLPRGADIAVHVIKKIKIKNKLWKLFFKFKISENKFKNHKKNLKILFRKKNLKKKL